MKEYFLVIQICSSVIGTCINPAEVSKPYVTHNQCALAGYELALKTHENIIQRKGEFETEQFRIAVKFWCKEKVGEKKIDA